MHIAPVKYALDYFINAITMARQARALLLPADNGNLHRHSRVPLAKIKEAACRTWLQELRNNLPEPCSIKVSIREKDVEISCWLAIRLTRRTRQVIKKFLLSFPEGYNHRGPCPGFKYLTLTVSWRDEGEAEQGVEGRGIKEKREENTEKRENSSVAIAMEGVKMCMELGGRGDEIRYARVNRVTERF